jgi:hypothetical protein
MSGRRRNSLHRLQFGVERRRLLAAQHGDAVTGADQRRFQRRYVGRRRPDQRPRAFAVERRAASDVEPGVDQLERLVLRLQRGDGHPQLLLQAAQVEVVARHFRRHAHLRRPNTGRAGQHVGLGRAPGVAQAAEQVDLPADIQPGGVVVVGADDTGVVRPADARGAGVDPDAGQQIGVGEAVQRARLAQAGGGRAHVGVGRQRPLDQAVEQRIVEAAPELADRLLRLDAGRRVGEAGTQHRFEVLDRRRAGTRAQRQRDEGCKCGDAGRTQAGHAARRDHKSSLRGSCAEGALCAPGAPAGPASSTPAWNGCAAASISRRSSIAWARRFSVPLRSSA